MGLVIAGLIFLCSKSFKFTLHASPTGGVESVLSKCAQAKKAVFICVYLKKLFVGVMELCNLFTALENLSQRGEAP